MTAIDPKHFHYYSLLILNNTSVNKSVIVFVPSGRPCHVHVGQKGYVSISIPKVHLLRKAEPLSDMSPAALVPVSYSSGAQ